MRHPYLVAFLTLSVMTAGAYAQETDFQKIERHDKEIRKLKKDLGDQTTENTNLGGKLTTQEQRISDLQAQLNAAKEAQQSQANKEAQALNALQAATSKAHEEAIKDINGYLNNHAQTINDLSNRLTKDDARLTAAETILNGTSMTTHSGYGSVDSKGQNGYFGTAKDDGPSLLQLTVTGNRVLEGSSDKTGGYLRVYAIGGKTAGELRSSNDGTGVLALYDTNSKVVASLFVDPKTGHGMLHATVAATGQDVAERFESVVPALRPGTVAAITSGGGLLPSKRPYDHTVVGVVSGAGSLSPGISLGPEDETQARNFVAIAGQVYVRVCLESGPVRPGDLLVASSRAGIAMRASSSSRIAGAVLGKALERFDSESKGANDEGLVRMLVMLR
jgi:hypothetical protein